MALTRMIGRAIVERLAAQGMAANRIIKIARAAGGGYRRTLMLEDIRVAGERFKNQFWVQKIRSNEVIPRGLMVESDMDIDRKYRVYGKMTLYDEEEDEIIEETKSFYTDDLADKSSWTDDFENVFSESYAAKGQEFIGFNITAVEHNKGYDY